MQTTFENLFQKVLEKHVNQIPARLPIYDQKYLLELIRNGPSQYRWRKHRLPMEARPVTEVVGALKTSSLDGFWSYHANKPIYTP